MISVNGIYENGKVTLLEPLPHVAKARVIVTILEEQPSLAPQKKSTNSWLGCMRGQLKTKGDIISPLEDVEWEVLK
ncbi:MAG: hypothetical protein HQM12_10110 [SAR324 cluster bacterium]|nr:hypothetical protein [SAR324 cluster bacterium]